MKVIILNAEIITFQILYLFKVMFISQSHRSYSSFIMIVRYE